MTRTIVVAVAAGATIGFLAQDPAPANLVAIVAVTIIGYAAIRHLRPAVASSAEALAADPLAEEMARARRFDQPLSLVALRPVDGASSGIDAQRLAAALSGRVVDRVLERQGATLLLLPGTARKGALVVAERVRSSLLPAPVAVAVVAFPADAATGPGLIDAALAQLEQEQLRGAVRPADSVS